MVNAEENAQSGSGIWHAVILTRSIDVYDNETVVVFKTTNNFLTTGHFDCRFCSMLTTQIQITTDLRIQQLHRSRKFLLNIGEHRLNIFVNWYCVCLCNMYPTTVNSILYLRNEYCRLWSRVCVSLAFPRNHFEVRETLFLSEREEYQFERPPPPLVLLEM